MGRDSYIRERQMRTTVRVRALLKAGGERSWQLPPWCRFVQSFARVGDTQQMGMSIHAPDYLLTPPLELSGYGK